MRGSEAVTGIRYGDPDEVLSQTDIITLHIPVTRHFINRERIAAMKHGVILVSTARFCSSPGCGRPGVAWRK